MWRGVITCERALNQIVPKWVNSSIMNDSASTSEPVSALGLEPGYLIAGRYEVVKLLGAGGFAAVFQAFDRQIERQVAIKVLNIAAVAAPGAEIEPFLERFRREARLAARIHHPNVVEIHDFGVLDDKRMPYIIMEMLEGHDLEEEISARGGMEPGRALPLFLGALEALGEAHRLGIVHKDLKPANLFLSRPGTRNELMKVVDFGIAHIGGTDEARMTQTGAMFGTPQYLSPEYVQTQTVGPEMDVYQMGLCLVEMLSGRSVVEDESPWQCALKHATGELTIPAALLDGELGPIIVKSLEFDPAERYPDALAFADALKGVDAAGIADSRDPQAERRVVETVSGPLREQGGDESGAAGVVAGGGLTGDGQNRSTVVINEQATEVLGGGRKRPLKKLLIALFLLVLLGVGGSVVALAILLDARDVQTFWERLSGEVAAVMGQESSAPKEKAKKAAPKKKTAKKKTTEKKAAPKKKEEAAAGKKPAAKTTTKKKAEPKKSATVKKKAAPKKVLQKMPASKKVKK